MYTRLLSLWENFRSSFWFVPSVLMVLATVLAVLIVWFDATIGRNFADSYPLFALSPPAARSILSSIVGAMVTSTGVVFSITVVALSLASSQFGSRLIRTFRNRRTTHFTLGIFVSTSLYCILVLATIRENESFVFVPTAATVVGISMTVVCLSMLIYYIHDMSKAIQAASVIQSSARDLRTAIRRTFPDTNAKSNDETESKREAELKKAQQAADNLSQPLFTADCDCLGYIQAIQYESCLELADQFQLIIRLLVRPGDFIQEFKPLAEVFRGADAEEAVDEERRKTIGERLRGCLIVGVDRTPTQDVSYAFNELVEIAVRALSPGINDPFTALNCVDLIHAALADLKRRKTPSAYRVNDDGQLRVIAEPLPFDEYVQKSLGTIGHYAKDSPMVCQHLEQALQQLSEERGH